MSGGIAMKKFSYAMLAGMMFFFLGWIFIRADGLLYGTLFCTVTGWIATKIDDERS
jgi:hypothetical protein